MKKLMIVAAVALAASFAGAAEAYWSTGTVKYNGADSVLGGSSGDLVGSEVTAYLFTTPANYASYLTAADIWADFDVANGTLAGVAATDSGTMASGLKEFEDLTDYSAGQVKAALVLVHRDGSGNIDAYSANTMYGTAESMDVNGVDTAALRWGDGVAQTGTATTWQAVPEPTSGLLLLLGMAGLALRRRRA